MSDIASRLEGLERRVGELEDIGAIRRLHWSYGYYIDFNRAEDVVQLFAEDGAVVFLSGEYRGHAGIRRLYGTWFQNFFTEGVDGPVYGFLLDHFQMQDIITVAPDRATAKGRFRGLLMGGCHESRDYKPAGLPLQFLEAGVYENDYVREHGVWKIKALRYFPFWHGSFAEGWAKTPIDFIPMAKTLYPEDPLGPDALIDPQPRLWPATDTVAFHYPHPVTGKPIVLDNSRAREGFANG